MGTKLGLLKTGSYDTDPYDQANQNLDPDPYDQANQGGGPDLSVSVTGEQEGPPLVNLPDIINGPGQPPTTGAPPPTNTPPPGAGGQDWSSFLQSLLGGFGGMNLGGLLSLLPMYYASQRAADSMENQAGKYGALGERAAAQADPWGNDRRKMYQGKLDELLADPTSSPVYRSMMDEAMKSLGPQLAAQGRAGDGQTTGGGDWLRHMGDVSNKFTGEWADRYGRFGGSEVDPANASRMLMEGGRLQGSAEQAALAARLYPLGALSSILRNNNSGNPSDPNGGKVPSIWDLLKPATNGGGKPPTGGGTPTAGGTPTGGPSPAISPLQLIAALNKMPMGSIPPELFSILQGNGAESLFGNLDPAQLELIFGRGYEDFITQNPNWINDSGEGLFNVGGGFEEIFTPPFDAGGATIGFNFEDWLPGD